ncbi:cholesterol esterase [Sporothrix epigloea]|uniref:Cholesterol esterase n=1 Tax=Sporothrix epigloea TaxID=1892477 RepID=A0ABP0E4N2_9PEZI
MPVPFIGRLNIVEYIALTSSFFLVAFEAVIRIFTLALPITASIREASDFVELCRLFGFTAEEHVFQTRDGYLLGLHRLAWRPGEEEQNVNSGPHGTQKRVVYLHHGLLMNSEIWVTATEAQRCLPFILVERGFDVWFGNNRGNKYSKKSVKFSSKSADFWNFSIDEFALYDIPDSIAYILETTGQPSLSYIGFSQGTAQAFASLAIHPKLNNQVNVFIALAPAMSPAGLSNGIVDGLVKASPQVLYLLFGRRSILSSATMWQSILYPPLFVHVIDVGLSFLFGWRTENIDTSQKLAAYAHLYSYTSTKSVVHWFQIIRTKLFQMYDDDVHPLLATHSKHTKVARYPTRNIKTPIVLIYGGSDSLVDIKAMLRELPSQTVATEIPHYEHLDFLWARDIDTRVFCHIFDALNSFRGAEHTKEEYARFHRARRTSLSASSYTSNFGMAHSDSNCLGDITSDSDNYSVDKATKKSAAVPREEAVQDTVSSSIYPPPLAVESDKRVRRSDGDLLSGDIPLCSRPGLLSQLKPMVLDEECKPNQQFPPSVQTASPTLRSKPANYVCEEEPSGSAATVRKVPSHKSRVMSNLSIAPVRGGKGGSIHIGSSKAIGGLTTEAALATELASAASSPEDGRLTGSHEFGRRLQSRGG